MAEAHLESDSGLGESGTGDLVVACPATVSSSQIDQDSIAIPGPAPLAEAGAGWLGLCYSMSGDAGLLDPGLQATAMERVNVESALATTTASGAVNSSQTKP